MKINESKDQEIVHCPECGLHVDQDELDMFRGYCEQCHDEMFGNED